jgi:hypothetical protein
MSDENKNKAGLPNEKAEDLFDFKAGVSFLMV